MSTALITAVVLGIAGLGYSAVLGYTTAGSNDLLRHTSFGIFSTLMTLLAHSMTMFYLIGKGKAVREAVTEGELSQELYRAVATARRPVFSAATMAMVLTMATAIFGGGVDMSVIPVGVHSLLALSALAGNLVALRAEVIAMVSSARIVDEVDRQLAGRASPNQA